MSFTPLRITSSVGQSVFCCVMSVTASRCCCGLLVKACIWVFFLVFLPHVSAWRLWLKGNSWCEYSGPFFNKAAQCCASAAASCLWKSLDAVWSREAPADGDAGHKFTQTRPRWEHRYCHSWHRAAFSDTAVSAWAKFLLRAVCPTGCSTIKWLPSISQSLTNVTLFSAAGSQCFSSGASHCHFAVLKLPECSNSELCSLKDHTGVFIFAPLSESVPELFGLTDFVPLCRIPVVSCQFSTAWQSTGTDLKFTWEVTPLTAMADKVLKCC